MVDISGVESATPQPPAFGSIDLEDAGEVLERFARIEDQFAQVRDGLNHLQRLSTLGTLTATVAHEFNNILTPIISYAELALARPGDAVLSAKAHRKAIENAERASRLCASLLGYTRDDDEASSADLPATVDAALGCLGRSLELAGIRVELDLPRVELAIRPSSLEQVLVNLILNARKSMLASHAGRGGLLTIRARLEPGGVVIDVSDTGGGIPSGIADRLFEPFVTEAHAPGDPTSSACEPAGESGGARFRTPDAQRPERGTGLGLSVCRDLIESAGGKITVTSRPGEGATFHLLIPAAQAERRSA